MHLREVRLDRNHPSEAFYRLTRLVHCEERHAAAIPRLDRIGSKHQRSVETCDCLVVAAQSAKNDAKQIKRLNVLRFATQDSFEETLGVIQLADVKRR